jgi:hypothetical protein
LDAVGSLAEQACCAASQEDSLLILSTVGSIAKGWPSCDGIMEFLDVKKLAPRDIG